MASVSDLYVGIQEAAYARGRSDALEEIAKALWPADGMDEGLSGEDDAFLVAAVEAGDEMAPRLQALISIVRKHRQERK